MNGLLSNPIVSYVNKKNKSPLNGHGKARHDCFHFRPQRSRRVTAGDFLRSDPCSGMLWRTPRRMRRRAADTYREFTEIFHMPAAAAFAWSDKFNLGYEPMDETHEEFVEIVNAMLTAPDVDLLAHLDVFMAHGEAHFAQELAWMTATAFPGTACHADEHEAVMKSVREVRDHLAAGGDPATARELAAALQNWFPGHADYLDSALAQWLVKKQSGGIPVVLRRNLTFEP